MDICEKISNAQCCVVDMGEVYVKASTFGINTNEMLNELLLFNSYIDALSKYKAAIDYEKLSDEDKVCADKVVSCLNSRNVCFMLEQISLSCEACKCGC